MEEIKEIFNFTVSYVNNTRYCIKKITDHTKIFRNKDLINDFSKEKLIIEQLEKGNSSHDVLREIVLNSVFSDLAFEITIFITESEVSQNGYCIIFPKEISDIFQSGLLETNIEIVQSYFSDQLNRIREIHIKNMHKQLNNMQNHTDCIRNLEKIATLCFVMEDYKTCINIIKGDSYFNELLFYCKLFSNQPIKTDFLYFSTDSNIYLRRLYFILSYSYTTNIQFSTIYDMLSRFEPSSDLLKGVVELELAIYLTRVSIYKRRIPLSLFYCFDIFNKFGLKSLALECLHEMESINVSEKVLEFCKNILKK